MNAVPRRFRNPKGLQATFDSVRADYDMSRENRFIRRRTGVNPMGTGPDYHYRIESKYYADIEQARDMDRNDGLVGILADRRVDNIVQSGFVLDPKTGDKKLDLDLWQFFESYSNDPELCDIAGESTFREMERVICRSESIDGDIIATGTEGGQLQIIEAHAIKTKSTIPGVFLGVETDKYGKRNRYYVLEELDVHGTKGESKPIEVRDEQGVRQLFHVYNPKRVLQTRGVTQLAPIFAYSGMLEDINFAKLVQQQVVSCFAIFRKMAANSTGLPSADAPYGETSSEQTASGTRTIDGIQPGMEIVGQPGEELQGFSPNVPNSEYFQQVRLILQIIGVNFGLPLCLVLMDGSETNFSGWRGAVDEARKGFVADQLNLVRRFHSPFWRWLVSHRMEKDAALKRAARRSGINIFGHVWNLPTWTYIEPVADAEGDATQLRNALTSPRRMHAARGKDWETIAEEIVADNSYAITGAMKAAAEINEANPGAIPVTWRDLIPLVMADGATLAMQDPVAMAANAGGEQAEQPAAGTSEFAGISRQQWNRNRKAINEVLQELAAGTTSETRARVFLGSVGLSDKAVNDLIADALDGTVETLEVVEGVDG